MNKSELWNWHILVYRMQCGDALAPLILCNCRDLRTSGRLAFSRLRQNRFEIDYSDIFYHCALLWGLITTMMMTWRYHVSCFVGRCNDNWYLPIAIHPNKQRLILIQCQFDMRTEDIRLNSDPILVIHYSIILEINSKPFRSSFP